MTNIFAAIGLFMILVYFVVAVALIDEPIEIILSCCILTCIVCFLLGSYFGIRSTSTPTAGEKLDAYSKYVADNTDEDTVFLKHGKTSSEVMTDKLLDKYYLVQQKKNSVQLISKYYKASKIIKKYNLAKDNGFKKAVHKSSAAVSLGNKYAAVGAFVGALVFLLLAIMEWRVAYGTTGRLRKAKGCSGNC